jgi:hypothetical protein
MVAYCYLSASFRINSAEELMEYKNFFEDVTVPILQAADVVS